MYPGIDPLDAAMVTPTGNAFRNAYFRNRINQVQLRGHYDHDDGFLDSIDFGVSYRSEEHTSELQSLMRISYAVFCLKKKNKYTTYTTITTRQTSSPLTPNTDRYH